MTKQIPQSGITESMAEALELIGPDPHKVVSLGTVLEVFERLLVDDVMALRLWFVDITANPNDPEDHGDLVAGVLLSQIYYWSRPGKDGATKLRVRKEGGQLWIAKRQEDWWQECRITPRQYERAMTRLCDLGLVEKRIFRFNNVPTTHIRLDRGKLAVALLRVMERVREAIKPQFPPNGDIGNPPNGDMEIPQTGKSLTEITTQTTTERVPAHSEVRVPSKKSEPRYVDMIGDSIEEEINPKSRFTPKDSLGQRVLDGLWSSKSWASAAQLRAWNKAKDKFPFDWMQSHFERARKHRWSRQGFLKAILNEDAFREWAGIELRRLSQTGGGLTERAKRLRQFLDPELPRREEPEQKTYTVGEEIPF